MTALLEAEVELLVPFHDVDAMGVVWHGHYVKYLEVARTELLRRFRYDYGDMRDSGYLWPVVRCELKYVKPARYGQRLKVRAALVEADPRLRIRYEIRDAESGARLTRAETVQAAVDAATGELQLCAQPLVAELLERVEP